MLDGVRPRSVGSGVLEARGVTYSYGRRRSGNVIDGLDWSVRPGEVTMLLGPNRAGKSTLLKLLCGYLKPTAGSVRLDGESSRAAIRDGVAWMPQEIQPARGMKVREQVEYVGWLAGRNRRDAAGRAAAALDWLDLRSEADRRSSELSGGQLRRLGLAQALTQGGSVLLLDEPTAGLDPAQAMGFRDLLRDLDFPGGIVVSTHQATDIASSTDAVVVLAGGAVRYDATLADFCALGGQPDGADAVARAYAHVMAGTGE